MHDVPRSDRPHGPDLAGTVAPDGMVPRLPPQPGALRPSAQRGVLRRVPGARESDRGRTTARGRVRHPETAILFDVSPMSQDTGRESLPSRSGVQRQDRREGWWRTLDELAEDPAFLEQLYNEFPSQAEAISDPVQRRTFLKLMGASLALAGAGACTRQPLEKIVPYVRQPEDVIPGRPLYYATAMTVGGSSSGLIVESHEGRPTKIEGNPDHPDNLGATD